MMDMEYSFEIFDFSFDLSFVSGDQFFSKDKVAVSMLECVCQGLGQTDEIVKLICKNRTRLTYEQDSQLRNRYVNLGIFNFNCDGGKWSIMYPGSPPLQVPIQDGKLSFEIRTLHDDKILDFSRKINRVWVRLGLKHV